MSLGTIVYQHKNGILLAHIADKMPCIYLRKLLKIIYLIDEHFMEKRGFPLTWFDYYVWAEGPVAPEVYAVIDGAFSDFVSTKRDDNGEYIINSSMPSPQIKRGVLFSSREISDINRLLETFKDKTDDELSGMILTPTSPWSKVTTGNHLKFESPNGRSEYLIPLTLLFADNDQRLAVYEYARRDMELQAHLNANRNPNHLIKLKVVLPSEYEELRNPMYTPVIP